VIEVTTVEIRQADDIAPGIEWLKGRADALLGAGRAIANDARF
jgi:hypothetical protein